MKYRESNKDKKLRSWFASDNTHALLRRILLGSGVLRGLNALEIPFEYPITAIAGKNGAGKSTILALACCAFHAPSDGFKLPKRKNSYYTFSDFLFSPDQKFRLKGSPSGTTLRITTGYRHRDCPKVLALHLRFGEKRKVGNGMTMTPAFLELLSFLASKESCHIANEVRVAHTPAPSRTHPQKAGKNK